MVRVLSTQSESAFVEQRLNTSQQAVPQCAVEGPVEGSPAHAGAVLEGIPAK